MAEGTNGSDSGRLDRVEKLLERLVEDHLVFRDEHRQLLKAQVILTDIVQKQAETMNTFRETLNTFRETLGTFQGTLGTLQEGMRVLDRKMAELAEAQKNADDRMAALIVTVDDIIRRPPRQ